jgi:hypothetical protein
VNVRPNEHRRRGLPACFLASLVASSCSGAQPSSLLSGDGGAADVGFPDTSRDVRLSDAPDDDAGEAGPEVDAGPPQEIRCDTALCVVGKQTCCRKGPPARATYTCTAADECTGLSIPCTNTADCEASGSAGDVCCGTFTTMKTVVNQVSCLPSTECVFADDRVLLCGKDDPRACPAGYSCQTSVQTLPGFDLCIENGD